MVSCFCAMRSGNIARPGAGRAARIDAMISLVSRGWTMVGRRKQSDSMFCVKSVAFPSVDEFIGEGSIVVGASPIAGGRIS